MAKSDMNLSQIIAEKIASVQDKVDALFVGMNRNVEKIGSNAKKGLDDDETHNGLIFGIVIGILTSLPFLIFAIGAIGAPNEYTGVFEVIVYIVTGLLLFSYPIIFVAMIIMALCQKGKMRTLALGWLFITLLLSPLFIVKGMNTYTLKVPTVNTTKDANGDNIF